MEEYYIPSHLNDQPRFYFWDMDEFIFLVTPIGLGIFIKLLIPGLILGIIASKWIRKLKAGRGAGVMTQTLYWFSPPEFMRMSRTPPSVIREFVG